MPEAISSDKQAASRRAGRLTPAPGKVLLFIGQDVDSINAYARKAYTPPSGWMTYTSIQALHGLDEPVEYGGGVQHARSLLKAYPKTALQIGFWMVDALEDVAGGRFDANIGRFARWLGEANVPVYLRIGYEFDLPENHYEPKAYGRAYRYLVERLREKDITNAAYVWHSYASRPAHPLEAWYPGDGYVDWCAVSVFDQSPGQWVPMAEFARAHQKPLMIAEATPRGIGTANAASWSGWWDSVRQYIRQYGVQALSYINTDWEAHAMFRGQGWKDSRIEANSQVASLWFEETARPQYLRGTPELFASLRFTPKGDS